MSVIERAACVCVVGVVVSGAAVALGGGVPLPDGRGSDGAGGAVVRVGFDAAVWPRAVSGRLIVFMVAKGSKVNQPPLEGPFWEEEQPLFAMDVKELAPGAWLEMRDANGQIANGQRAKVEGQIDFFPRPLSELAPGEYRVQARLDTQRTDSNWKREAGNLFTKSPAVLVVKAGEASRVELKLDAVTEAPKREVMPGVEWFSVRSELLSKFRGRDVVMRAGVVMPIGFDPAKKYAAVYEVPGFGGNDEGAEWVARGRAERAEKAKSEERKAGAKAGEKETLPAVAEPPATLPLGARGLDASTFWIVLDPEGPNGHTLFADSANNGPCGRALVEELIPALEKKYPLSAKPEARLLRGHSSGGWSTLWLATEYPAVFGACWSSSPDPVDFRRFQLANIYDAHWFYGFPVNGLRSTAAYAAEVWAKKVPQGVIPSTSIAEMDLLVSFRRDGKAVMTVKREARGEDALGPDNTSGQQWDSWFAAWGPRNASGNPAALFDPQTGAMDAEVAKQYRAYDIAERLRKEPAKYGPLFRDRVRLVVGGSDNFFLNEAVELLKKDVEAFVASPGGKSAAAGAGYIKIVPGLDHSTIFGSEELKGFEVEMAEYVNGLAAGK